MRNFSLGVPRRDLILFAAATVLAIAVTIVWMLFLVDIIGGFWVGNEQRINKYFLTVVLIGLAIVVSAVSLLGARRESGARGMLPGFLVRFGLALQIFGILITPIALRYSTNPTISVPVGFASFTTVFAGLFLAGLGANMQVPRRA